MRTRRGQTILEYTVIMVIILGVVLTMKDSIKRGLAGRWQDASKDLSDQYDPQYVNSNILYTTLTNSQSQVSVINGSYNQDGQNVDGQWTNRIDTSVSEENKTGSTQVGN